MPGTMTGVDDMSPERDGEDVLAAEYVLGVLPAEERKMAAQRIDADPGFAARVDAWEARLSPLAAAYAEIEPPASVKSAIDRRLGATSPEAAKSTLWHSLALWRMLAAAAIAAIVLLLFLPYSGTPPTDEAHPRLVASLTQDGTDVHYYAVYDRARRRIDLAHVSGALPADSDFELWVIEGTQAPVSLGVIPAGANVQLAVTEDLERLIAAGSVFAISLEPEGGSPTGAPTGPVVAAGGLATI